MFINLVAWAAIGLNAGWLANRLEGQNSMGVLLDSIIGCLGALVGALMLSLIVPQQAPAGVFDFSSVAAALVIAALFLSIARLTVSRGAARSNRQGDTVGAPTSPRS